MTLLLDEFKPKPAVVRPQTHLRGPSMPFIDAHNHLGRFGGNWAARPAEDLFVRMEDYGCIHYVDLDGGWGEDILDDRLRRYKALHPERYRVFGGVDWSLWEQEGNAFAEKAAARLRAQAARGAQGLKIWKPFGLTVRDQHGTLAAVDDPRLDPIWETAGELNLPVLIHVADPVAFFDPVDAQNERWDELGAHPEWSFPSPPFPTFLSIVEGFANLVRRHQKTTFIGAHVACYAENLAWVSALLDQCPNLYIDFSARIAELGRVPYSARELMIRHSARILFGTDAGPSPEAWSLYARFLETRDEYFNYSPEPTPPQGRWMIYGLHLPQDVLCAIYHDNAARLFGLQAAETDRIQSVPDTITKRGNT
ncbi:amidohydrolase family protein [Pelagibacterium sp. H642]|uniref:amidohydrolase family protein n=1 Tax=Pelagibacterium sp. H642 TaxID=1881069 RepID=UPI00281660D7|nr:amidohydrolase family protein [Pelagibacterium sp. H642]WMT92663.1 amidohydrolase family protein [Pelagibacterium sp. H642]